MESTTRDRFIFALLLLFVIVVVVFDVAITPDTLLPGSVYAVPILVAAYFLSPALVAWVVAYTLALQLVAILDHHAPFWLSALYTLAPAIAGFLGVKLAIRTRREWSLRTEMAARNGQLLETNRELSLARQKAEDLAAVAFRRAAEMEGTLNNMVEGVLVCDVAGHISLTNGTGARLLGLASPQDTRPELSDLPQLLRIRRPDGKSLMPEELPLYRALQGQVVVLEDEVIRDPTSGRDVYIRTSAAPIKDESGIIAGAVEVTRDVTELTELDRLKDQFIGMAAHELKTPVTIMKGYAQLLLRQAGDLPHPAARMLAAIDQGATRIDKIIRELLDISQLQSGELELAMDRVDLPELLEQIAEHMSMMTSKHRIQVAAAGTVIVQGDRSRLSQVIENLIDNAIRYSPAGGDITVALMAGEREAVVSVTDRGVGIPLDKQERVFQQFYRPHQGTPDDYGGTGVGLYISKEIIARHGGRMWFESEAGKGSTFYLSLPVK